MHSYERQTGKAATSSDAKERLQEGADALAQSKDELLSAFENLVDEGKAFVKSTAGLSGEAVEEAREKLAARLADVKYRWGDWSQTARTKGRQAALAADDYVHAKPWLAVALVAGAAFLIATLTT